MVRQHLVLELMWGLVVLGAIVTLTLAEAPTPIVLALIASMRHRPGVRPIPSQRLQAKPEEL